MVPPIAINTLAYHGYPLETALEEIARLAGHVEPVFISKYDPSLTEDYFDNAHARALRKRMGDLQVKITSMASHMDLGQANAADVFQRRMEFAKAIGARLILTNASVRAREAAFFRNLERLAALAEDLDLTIALENPGDGQDQLLGAGMDGIAILEKVGASRVKLNYDFSNIITYSRGTRRPEEELEALLPHLAHCHLKNLAPCAEGLRVCGIGEGIVDYAALFRRFPSLLEIPMSIEAPLRFGYDADYAFRIREPAPLPLDRIARTLAESLDFLRRIAENVPSLKRDDHSNENGTTR
ncbi:MAG: TIM barrel protein [Candidatus Sumerlaeota bacterium]|nr:TIM barrel protein [Candidatus Sumerlaeota bacterium]